MGAAFSSSILTIFPFFARFKSTKLTREQQRMVHQYLPDFPNVELSTEMQRQIASHHWNTVFRDAASSRSSRTSSGSYSVGRRSSNGMIDNRITRLYDTFYMYLDHNSPDLKHVFRASMHVRSKVLVHISGGIRSILASDQMPEKVAALTQTHLRFGIQLEYFNPLGNALLHAMKETSDGVWSDEIENAWRHLFAHCSALLLVQHKAALDRKQQVKKLEIQVKGAMEYDIYSSPRKLPILEQTT
ncbi:hypothetical protein Poli38472_006068 [Pythium oligandrum]|uniref:Globin domain-containing protein n=1 Tax=Pythium oligandrum TaxID=41045 RepID=A0A8K1CTX1_PYTOL|nr:hypothetical protein Poli38472_006068 [Pythium oligandrum]|eukprot:TMW68600.1 hypothetical protein Poli38472_006068 [Pythium oligandrum]